MPVSIADIIIPLPYAIACIVTIVGACGSLVAIVSYGSYQVWQIRQTIENEFRALHALLKESKSDRLTLHGEIEVIQERLDHLHDRVVTIEAKDRKFGNSGD